MDAAVRADVRGGLLRDIGGFGIYQKFSCVVVVAAINGLCALSLATQLFSLITPDHWCFNPVVAALEHLSLAREDAKKFSIPTISTGHLPWSEEVPLASFSQCQRYDGDLAGAYISWVAAKRPLTYIPVTPGNRKTYPVRGCDQGWIYNHTFHTLTTENDWVCDSKWKPYVLHTAFWLGASIGACVCGHMANRFGRRISLIAGMLLHFLGGVATLLTSGFILLLASRFVIGFGYLTTSFLALLLVLELCDEQHQVIPLLAMMTAHTTTTLAAPWVAYNVTSWWWLTLITTILSAAVSFMVTWVVPESPWCMFNKGCHEDAVQLLQRIAKVNGKAPLQLNHKSLEECCDFWTNNHRSLKSCCLQNKSNSRNDLLESARLRCSSCRKQFIAINTLWVLCGLCYYGNYYTSVHFVTTVLGTRSDPSDIFVSYWYAALMEIPIWILPFILQGHLRIYQVTFVLSLTSAAILSICHAILPTEYVVLNLTLGLMHRFSVAVAYYTSVQRRWEFNNIFDRISVASTESPMGLAVAIVPSILYVGEYYSRLPSLIFGIAALLAAVMSMFLPVQLDGLQEVHEDKSLQWLRRLHYKKHRKPSVSSTENGNEDETPIVPYSPLEST